MTRLTQTFRLLPLLALATLGGCVAYPYQGDAAPGTYIQSGEVYAPPVYAAPVYVAPPPVIVGGWWGPRPYYRGHYGHGRRW